jgi:GWxTD domain-containing protein
MSNKSLERNVRDLTGGTMKRTAVFLAFALASTAAWAGGLSKYKKWDATPESYFMTKGERLVWKNVRTDADAEKFIEAYKVKRGPDFEKTLAERVAVADKYFTSGSTKGSETLRGKVIIMFGPPSAIDQSKGGSAGAVVDPNSQGIGGSKSGSVTMSSGGASPVGSAPAAQTRVNVPTMTFIYDADHAPKAIGKPFRAEVNMLTSTYQEPTNADDLNAKFEAVAEASTHPESPKEAPKEAAPPPNAN